MEDAVARRSFTARRQSERPTLPFVVDKVEDNPDGNDLRARRARVRDHGPFEDRLQEHDPSVDRRVGTPRARAQPGRIGSDAAQVLQFKLERSTFAVGDQQRSRRSAHRSRHRPSLAVYGDGTHGPIRPSQAAEHRSSKRRRATPPRYSRRPRPSTSVRAKRAGRWAPSTGQACQQQSGIRVCDRGRAGSANSRVHPSRPGARGWRLA